MNKADFIVLAKALFQSYPSVNEFYFTNDGNAFEQRHTAESHANTLSGKLPEVTTVTRQEIEEPGSGNEIQIEDGTKDETQPGDDSTTESVQTSIVKKKNK
jgi:hypothetical protein